MIAAIERPAERMLLHNVSWHVYESLLNEAGERHIRFTYDDGDLEIMTLSLAHENAGEWIGRLIVFLTFELKYPLFSGGSTTFKASLRKKGLEPDKSYWIRNADVMRGKTGWHETDPPPDIVVEVDISHSSLNRLGIYAGLKVPEIWHFNGATFKVLRLAAGGKYRTATKSGVFPALSLKAFVPFVHKLGGVDENVLLEEFRQWVRDNVLD
jgi:Uma2 family endonuclease